jgi:hypothetical protein
MSSTWSKSKRLEIPTIKAMPRLLKENKRNSEGSDDKIRKQFKRTFAKGEVVLKDNAFWVISSDAVNLK